jgi:hypothetical protein
MRFGWALMVAVMLVAVACSSCGDDLSLTPLGVKGALQVTGGYCEAFAKEMQTTFTPSDQTSTAEVYEVEQGVVDQQYATNMAQELGLAVTPQYDPSYRVLRYVIDPEPETIMAVPAFVSEDAKATLAIEERTGIIHYNVKAPTHVDPNGGALSDEESTIVARRFLSGLGLLPTEDAMVMVEGSQVRWRPTGISLAEPYTLFGIYVTVESDGSVSYFEYAWQHLRRMGKYPLLSEAEALRLLHKCEGTVVSAARGVPTVGEVRLEHLLLPAEGPYRYLVPIYHFGNELALEATRRPENPKDSQLVSDAWVLAVAEEYIEAPPSE